MKAHLALGIASIALLLGACESSTGTKDSLRQRWTARYEGQTRTFSGDQRQVFEAAKDVAKSMGYRIVRGGPAQGTFEAASGLESDAALRSSRQMTLKVKLSGAADGTELNAVFFEIFESDSQRQPGMGTETPLKDGPMYELYFAHVSQALKQK